MTPFRAGFIALVLIVLGSYFGFTKANPFSHPYTFKAAFESAAETKVKSPVRIAGVNVGEVSDVKPIGNKGAALLTMKISKEGLPIHKDAQLKIRQRIFLEGNKFIDLQPGSPSAPILKKGDTIPSNQTATPVQFADLLTALQSDTRSDLQTFLREYSKGLAGGGARGFNRSIPYWVPAYKNSALANDATLGTKAHDLSRLLKGQAITFGALARDETALQGLISNLNTTAEAFAVHDVALQQTIPALDNVLRVGSPALRSLNDSLPSLRAFARDALPGTISSGPTLKASLPFIHQANLLMRESELKGLARTLRAAIPALARLQKTSVPFFKENRALSSCQNRVIVPFAKEKVPDQGFPDNSDPFYKQSSRGFVGLSGESRVSDAHSQMFRVNALGGNRTIAVGGIGSGIFAQAAFPIDNVEPAPPNKRPPFRPDVACETMEVPGQSPVDLHAAVGTGDPTVHTTSTGLKSLNPKGRKMIEQVIEVFRLQKMGIPALDPMTLTPWALKQKAKRLNYKQNVKGVWVPAAKLEKAGGPFKKPAAEGTAKPAQANAGKPAQAKSGKAQG
jgi:virulence factor Mce-like protein